MLAAAIRSSILCVILVATLAQAAPSPKNSAGRRDLIDRDNANSEEEHSVISISSGFVHGRGG